jgi:hypothetical protein
MDTLVWLLLGVAMLIAVHMGILIYLYRATVRDSGGRHTDAVEQDCPQRTDGTDSAVCPACGAPNDPAYRFCRRCVSDLSAGKTAVDGDGPERLGS